MSYTIKRTHEIHIAGLITATGRPIHSMIPIPASAETGHTYDSLQSAFDEARILGPVCRTCSMAAGMLLNRSK